MGTHVLFTDSSNRYFYFLPYQQPLRILFECQMQMQIFPFLIQTACLVLSRWSQCTRKRKRQTETKAARKNPHTIFSWQGCRSEGGLPTRSFALRPTFKQAQASWSLRLCAIISKKKKNSAAAEHADPSFSSLAVADAHPRMSVAMNKKWTKCFIPILNAATLIKASRWNNSTVEQNIASAASLKWE